MRLPIGNMSYSLLYFIAYNFTEIQYNNTHTFICVSCAAFPQYEPSLYFNSALVSDSALDQLLYFLSACVTGKPHYPISIRRDVLKCGFSVSYIVCHLTAQMLTADQNDKSCDHILIILQLRKQIYQKKSETPN